MTSSEDELKDYYKKGTRANETMGEILQDFAQKKLTPLDKVLLAGVYTNDKHELYLTSIPGAKASGYEECDSNELFNKAVYSSEEESYLSI